MPGLAENRPSVIVGDTVFVRENTFGGTKQNKEDKEGNKQIVEAGIRRRVKEYEGFIHEVEGERVLLKFHQRSVEVIARDTNLPSCQPRRILSKGLRSHAQ